MTTMKYLNRNGAKKTEDDPLTSKVIGLAIEIHKELGTGFLESIYHRALEIELAAAVIFFVTEAPLVVKYKDHILGTFAADLIIENKLLIELKALENLPLSSEVQVVNYLKASNIEVGLILNFGTAPLEIKRKYRTRREIDPNLRLHET
jgi:GxxExxY protein